MLRDGRRRSIGRHSRMTDPDVVLTDYGLTVLCAILAWRASRSARPPLKPWLVAFFAAGGIAPLLGGTVHGFFPEPDSLGYSLLWPATLIAIGAVTVAAWSMGLRVGGVWRGGRPAMVVVYATFVLYVAVVLSGRQEFAVAMWYYLPGAIFLFASFLLAHQHKPTQGRKLALIGLAVTFVAAAIQRLGIPLHPEHFDHNALYHLVQGAGLLLFYLGAREE